MNIPRLSRRAGFGLHFPVRHLGVRDKLTLLITLIMVPLLALQVLTIYTHLERRVTEEVQASRELGQATVAAFANYLENLWDSEIAMGTAISTGLSGPAASAYLRSQLQPHSTVTSLSWADSNGVITASTLPKLVGRSLAFHSDLARVMSGDSDVLTNLIESQSHHRNVLYLAKAIRSRGELKGVVIAAIDPKALSRVLPVERHGASNLGITDRNGVMIYRSNDPRIPDKNVKIGADSPAWSVLESGQRVEERNYVSTIDGSRRIGVFLPIARVGWVVGVTSKVDEVLGSARVGALRDSLALLLIVTFSLFGVALISDSFVGPVNSLKQAAESISNGDLTARTGLTGHDELATTGQAFDRMVDRIQHLESERTRFLQVAAHELRNPMATVKGASSLLRLQLAKGKAVEEDALEDLRILEKEVDRLSALLNEMLDAFRLHEGHLALNLQPVDIVDVVESALQPFRAIDENHVFLLRASEGAVVLGDFRRLEDVLRNLISNACKYSPPGTEVKVSVGVCGARAIVSIHDEGFGIPKNELPRVFESFYRASNLKGRDPEGMGLGLNICENIVQRHGGRIWAESQEERGSTFFVELPLYEPTRR
jgi:signal transduction histidine kinase